MPARTGRSARPATCPRSAPGTSSCSVPMYWPTEVKSRPARAAALATPKSHRYTCSGPPRPPCPGDQDVARLDVAVHQTRVVDGVQGVGHRPQQRAQPLDAEPALAPEYGAEVLPVDEPHRQVQHAVRMARVVDRHTTFGCSRPAAIAASRAKRRRHPGPRRATAAGPSGRPCVATAGGSPGRPPPSRPRR